MNEQLNSAVQEQAKSLLDIQLSNLSQRLFEVGKKADQQLTAWLTFAALTILLCFGAAETVSIGGLQLRATVAAAVTYGLACAFYYRAVLSMAALQIWRESLRERRKLRFSTLLQFAKEQGPEVEMDTNRDVNGFVSEYPGYLACSVLVKDEGLKRSNLFGQVHLPCSQVHHTELHDQSVWSGSLPTLRVLVLLVVHRYCGAWRNDHTLGQCSHATGYACLTSASTRTANSGA
jgi:hypothetical protein